MTKQPVRSRLIVVTAVSGPGDDTCCRDFGTVITCDDVTDTWECPFCGTRWTAPCPAATAQVRA